jgi:hypothetical protein
MTRKKRAALARRLRIGLSTSRHKKGRMEDTLSVLKEMELLREIKNNL